MALSGDQSSLAKNLLEGLDQKVDGQLKASQGWARIGGAAAAGFLLAALNSNPDGLAWLARTLGSHEHGPLVKIIGQALGAAGSYQVGKRVAEAIVKTHANLQNPPQGWISMIAFRGRRRR